MNFSSGDYTFDYPLGSPASVSFPANSPYATAVGGTSLALNSDGSIDWQLGWGNNENLLAESGFVQEFPSESGYFYAGS